MGLLSALPGAVPDISDGQLMRRLADGDMGALEKIYMQYGAMTRAAIRRAMPQVAPSDLEEFCQDVFLQVLRSAGRFDPARTLKPWIYGIALRVVSEKRRSGALHMRLLGQHHEERRTLNELRQSDPHASFEAREDLLRAFAALSKEQHEVMVLHVVEGFSGEEIAQILGIRVNTVWTRLHRARRVLMDALTPGEGTP